MNYLLKKIKLLSPNFVKIQTLKIELIGFQLIFTVNLTLDTSINSIL